MMRAFIRLSSTVPKQTSVSPPSLLFKHQVRVGAAPLPHANQFEAFEFVRAGTRVPMPVTQVKAPKVVHVVPRR